MPLTILISTVDNTPSIDTRPMTAEYSIEALSAKLPIIDVLPALCNALTQRDEAVLEAPPGAGKTTIVPLALLQQTWLQQQKILMLEPRRLAAKSAALRMAELIGETVGETVGYRMRLESKVGPKTRIEVITEGILTRMLQSDPSLEGIGLVIFDEFHERSLEADLALALSLYARPLFRDHHPLKVLAMSATLDGDAVSALLDQAPIVRSAGRMFPVHTRYVPKSDRFQRIDEHVAQVILQALSDEPGSLLVFLPGQSEIRKVAQQLSQEFVHHPSLNTHIEITPLYGDLDLKQQQRAIAPAKTGQRKIVLATAIAETSLTIDGVRVVIDSGLSRLPYFDPNTALTRLHTVRVSQAASEQRQGRAGRTEAGVCYRCWASHEQTQLPRQTPAEIMQADLTPLALQLLQWGVTPDELSWVTPPPSAAYQQACDLLQQLGALDDEHKLTRHGENMASLPVHPRLAHMLIQAQQQGLGSLACEIAALLGERDICEESHASIHLRLSILRGELSTPKQRQGALSRIQQQQKQFNQLLNKIPGAKNNTQHATPDLHDATGRLLAWAYPDRIARQRKPGTNRYQLSNGRGASLTEHDKLNQHEWLVVASLGSQQSQSEERIYLAAPLNPNEFEQALAEQVSVTEHLGWDRQRQEILAEQQYRIGRLLLKSKPLDCLNPEQVTQALLNAIRELGLQCLPWDEQSRRLQNRIASLHHLAATQHGTIELPDLSDAALLRDLENWLPPYLANLTKVSQLQTLKLYDILQALLSWEQQTQLNDLAPVCYEVPTGSRISIDYNQSPPVLAVKLQELFGLNETPSIAKGELPLQLHLLSPAQRPVQVTQDLAHFWANSYHAVKKDLKGRYPKHPWPDDPANATPAKGTKKQEQRRLSEDSAKP